MTTRRGFFGILGGAAVGGKKAVAEAAASLTSGLSALSPLGENVSYNNLPRGSVFDGEDEGLPKLDVSAMRIIGIPEWLRQEWREEMEGVTRFDPDIASMRSLSLSAKINLQMDRNMARCEKEFWSRGTRNVERSMWKKLHGRIGWW